MGKRDKIEKYYKNIERVNSIIATHLILFWDVITQAKSEGEAIWPDLTIDKLSKDFGLTRNIVKRCLLLNHVTKKEWTLIQEKELDLLEHIKTLEKRDVNK